MIEIIAMKSGQSRKIRGRTLEHCLILAESRGCYLYKDEHDCMYKLQPDNTWDLVGIPDIPVKSLKEVLFDALSPATNK